MKTGLIESFVCGREGIIFVSRGRNFRIQLVLMAITVIFGIGFSINEYEWLAIAICSALVLSAEAFNTAVELLCDKLLKIWKGELVYDEDVKWIKNTSCGAVTLASALSALCGAIIFILKIWALS